MLFILTAESGPSAGRQISIRSNTSLIVGRTDASDMVFSDDAQISGRHFQLRCETQRCVVEDLNSSNGSFLNGERIREAVLKQGDILTVGQTSFRVDVEKPAPVAAPVSSRGGSKAGCTANCRVLTCIPVSSASAMPWQRTSKAATTSPPFAAS